MSLTKVPSSQLANSGFELGMRNKIINGAFGVDQRNSGVAQTFTAAAVLAYCVDRFYGYCTGANVTGQRVTIGGTKRYRFTGAASNTGVGFGTRLEAVNTSDMASQDASLQVKLSSSSLTSIGWAVYYANTADTFGTLASPTRTLITSGTFTITSTEATYTADVAMPSGAITGIEIVFTGGALLAAQTLTIGDVQFELGSEPTRFEWRSYRFELAECQRYYQRMFDSVSASCNVLSYSSAAANISANFVFPVQMRDTPVVTKVGTWSVSNASQPIVSAPSKYGFVLFATVTALGSMFFNNATPASQHITAEIEL